MGWSKRSSGTRYDSISGHGMIIGEYSKRVIGFKCFSKECSALKLYPKKGKTIHNLSEDECMKNLEDSSKSMQCEAILRLF